ncbi:hypothetical protein KI387_008401, partial [Taxus chinensis]
LVFHLDWKPQKFSGSRGRILRSVVRSRDLASSVLVEESFSCDRLHENVFSDDSGLSSDVKVYVYDLSSRYNEDWLVNSRCSSHLFSAEVAIHRALLGSSVRVFNPLEANFFFIPVYVSCNFSTRKRFPVYWARSLTAWFC